MKYVPLLCPLVKDYAHYVNYKQTVNAKEAVGGFLWATAIVEKPGQKPPK